MPMLLQLTHSVSHFSLNNVGMVVIQGAIILECPTAERTMEIFDAGNKVRHVGATKMNAESSRSHLIFAVLIKVFDKQTKKTANGKFSFIDLAGSERAGKTGATADRLKEAMSINKSLSALGNVISALSTGEKFIPYRDNKLTLVMSDSLGGNAKTLMFVNVSPADYNQVRCIPSLYGMTARIFVWIVGRLPINDQLTHISAD